MASAIILLLTTIELIFSWNPPNPAENVQGYKLYEGDVTGSYPRVTTINSGSITSYSHNVTIGAGKFFVLRSWNEWGESGNSEEVVVRPPQPPAQLNVRSGE